MAVESFGGVISTAAPEIMHTEWPCVGLDKHYDGEGNLMPCKEAIKQGENKMRGHSLQSNKVKEIVDDGKPLNLPRPINV